MSSSSYPTASVYEEKLSQSYNKPLWKPSPKAHHSSALVTTPWPTIFVFGGGNQNTENEVFCLEVMKKQWKIVKLQGEKIAFEKSVGPAACTIDGKIYAFIVKDTIKEIRALCINPTTSIVEDLGQRGDPGARWGQSIAAVPSAKKIYMFGGQNSSHPLDDLYSYDYENKSWKFVLSFGAVPSPRFGHSCTLVGNILYVFGGNDGSRYLNDIYVFDLETNSWSVPAVSGTGPSPRANVATVTYGDKIFFVGGKGQDGICADSVYILQIVENELLWFKCANCPEAAREGHTAHILENLIYLIGGTSSTKNDTEVYVLNSERLVSQHNMWRKPTPDTKRVPSMPGLLRSKATNVSTAAILGTPSAKKDASNNFKIIASVGDVSSVFNLKVDMVITVDAFLDKILRRFDTGGVEYAIFIPLESEKEEGGIWMDEGTLGDWDSYLEESKFTVEVKKKSLKKSGLMDKVFRRRASVTEPLAPLKISESAISAICNAARDGLLTDITNLIKQEGKDVVRAKNSNEETPLHLSAGEGHLECVSLLLKYKPDLNARDRHQWTPLHSAAAAGHMKIVDLLIKEGAEVTSVTKDGNNVLHYVAKLDWNETISGPLLRTILKKLDVNAVNLSNESPVHRASFSGNIEFVKIFIKNKVDLNIRNKHGETCLHFAARAGRLEMFQLLIDNGADWNISGDQGSVRQVAEAYSHKDIIDAIPTSGGPKQSFEKENELLLAEISTSDISAKPLLEKLYSKYQEELNKRLKVEETLALVKITLKNEVESSGKTHGKFEDFENRLKEENKKRVKAEDELVEQLNKNKTLKDLLKNEGKTRNELKQQIATLQEKNSTLQTENAESSLLRSEKDKLIESLEIAQEKYKNEENIRRMLEEKLTEKNKECSQAYQEIATLQSLLSKYEAPASVEALKEKHLQLAKDLKNRVLESHFREWDAIYSSQETDEAIGKDRNEQSIHEWHMNKISEIQNTFYPTGEEFSLCDPHRRFIRTVTMTTVVRGSQTPLTLFLFNDILMICTLEENHKTYLFSSIIPIDFCSIEPVGKDDALKNGVIIVRKDTKQTMTLYAPTALERDKWIKEVQTCISSLPPLGVSDDKLLRTSKSQAEIRTDRAKFKDKFKTLVKGPERTQSEMTLKAKTSKEVSAMFQAVESNESTFTKLDLGKANLKAKGIISLAASAQNNSVLTQIILSQNNMEDRGLQALVTSLEKVFPKLTFIALDGNGLHLASPIIEILRKSKNLVELNISDNNYGDEMKGIVEEAQGHKTLRIFNISSTQVGDSSAGVIGDFIRTNHTITEFYCENNSFTNKGETVILKALAETYASALTVFNLKSSGVVKAEIDLFLKKSKERLEKYDRLEKSGKLSLADFTDSEVLDLANSRFDKFSSPQLGKITTIYLDNCGLAEVPAALATATHLHTLVLINNRISVISQVVLNLVNLVTLDMSLNFISRVPAQIEKLSNLVTLGLAGNQLYTIPSEISKLSKLRKLYLHGNFLSVLPPSITQMSTLDELFLASNPMPYALQRIYQAWASKATELDLSNQGLSALPAAIGSLKYLTVLKIAKNSIKMLPPQLAELSSLKTIDARENLLEEVPWQLSNLPNLSSFLTDGNPKLYMPDSIQDIKTFLSQKEGRKEKPFRRMKIMLVGRENVGKTSLRQCLQAKSIKQLIKMKKEQGWNLSTDGIDMDAWVPTEEERGKVPPISFSIWDFAGQEVYYTTHQFFINPRSIFLLVFNLKEKGEETARVDYWLQSIRARSDASPVILVGTHADEVDNKYIEEIHEYMTKKYLSNFPNIKSFLTVSCMTRKGIPQLQETLIRMALSEPYINTAYPSSFHQLESLISSQRDLYTPPVVTKGEFSSWAASCGVAMDEFDSASRIMTELGVILHYNKTTMEDMVILDPQWLTKLMATLITSKPNFVKNGVLPHSVLNQIWKAPDFPESLHSNLLFLLEKFEICFPFPSEKEPSYLVPCLVTADKPTEPEKPVGPAGTATILRRLYRFNFLPFGFFSRLVIRMLHFMTPLQYWRNSIQLKTDFDGRCLLEVQATDGLQLSIEVTGANAIKYLRLIVENVEILIRGWYKIPYNIVIPCPCPRCLISKKTTFSFQECEKAVVQGKTSLTCVADDTEETEVRIDTLAPDIMMSDMLHIKIQAEDLIMGEMIGRGGFGEVYKAQYKSENVAVKKLVTEGLSPNEVTDVFREFRREVWLSSALNHPNVVKLIGCCMNPCALVMEFVPHGNLLKYLQDEKNQVSMTMKLKIALNIADAMRFLHSKTPKIIHRDLKTPNILMVTFSDAQDIVCKLSDFGESIVVATKAQGRQNLGNPCWCAPEIMKKEPYTEKSDCFSMGIILWELVTRKLPYSEHAVSKSNFVSQFEDAIIKGLRPTVPADCHPELKRLMTECWKENADERPSFEKIYEDVANMLKSMGVQVKVSKAPPPRPMNRPPTIVGKSPPVLSMPNLKSPVVSPPPATKSTVNMPITRTVSSIRANLKAPVPMEPRAKEAEEVPKSPRSIESRGTVSQLRNQLDGKINVNLNGPTGPNRGSIQKP